tara:strand:+ start:458 stop:907 length:450 start_codon:yes stop_codon:yes gene_type:complete
MATNTLLQSLNDSANQATSGSSNRRQVETFLASAAIAANDLVCLDITKTADSDKALFIKKADTTTGATIVAIGFALNAAADAGDEVRVTIAGVHESAATSASAVGMRLMASSTAGRAIDYTGTATVPPIAYAVEVHTANVATVIVIKQI